MYTPILGTLGYLVQGNEVLLIRKTRPQDPAYGKYNGLGGKLEPGEDLLSGMRREIREESGLEAEELWLRGTISWPGFGAQGEDWFGFIFLVTRWRGTLRQSPEGVLEWVPLSRLLRFELEVWPGDRYFLPLVFDRDPRPFHGVMHYREGKPVSWRVQREGAKG
jgi:8-oxo-dGTP diphosphatase